VPDDVSDNPTRDGSVEPESPVEAPAAPPRSRRKKAPQRSFLKELPILLFVALVLSFVIQTFLARVYVIPSESMEPTLLGCSGCGITNDRIVVDKVGYRFSDPRAGDVVVFKGPDSWSSEFSSNQSGNVLVRGLQQVGAVVGLAPPNERDFVKRVIATGGQTVTCCDAQGDVQVDGAPLTEPYVVNDFPFVPGTLDCTTPAVSGRCFAPVTVPEGHLWMMGDNRNNSADSRYHVGDAARGTVPVGNVVGKARIIIVPVSRWQLVDSPQINPTASALGAPTLPDTTPALLGALVMVPGLRRLRGCATDPTPGGPATGAAPRDPAPGRRRRS
jgi:signal peptidase I